MGNEINYSDFILFVSLVMYVENECQLSKGIDYNGLRTILTENFRISI